MAILDIFKKESVADYPLELTGQDVLRLLTSVGMLTTSPDQEFFVTGNSISTREQIIKDIKKALRESLEPVTVGLLSAQIDLDVATTQTFLEICLPEVHGVVQDGYNYYSQSWCEQLMSHLRESMANVTFISSLDFCHKHKLSWKLLKNLASQEYLVEDGVILDKERWGAVKDTVEEKTRLATEIISLEQLLEEATGSRNPTLLKVFVSYATKWIKASGCGRVSGNRFTPNSLAQDAQENVKKDLESTGYVPVGDLKSLRKKVEVVAQDTGLGLTTLSQLVVNDGWVKKETETALKQVADAGFIEVAQVDYCRGASLEDNKTLVEGFVKAASRSKVCDTIRNGSTVEFVVDKSLNSKIKAFLTGELCVQLAKAETARILKANTVQELAEKSAEGFVDQHVISDVSVVPSDSQVIDSLATKFPQLPKKLLQLYGATYRTQILANTKDKTVGLVMEECDSAVVYGVTYLSGLQGLLKVDKKVGKKLVDGCMVQIKDNVPAVGMIALDSEMSKLEGKVGAQIDILWDCVRIDDKAARVSQCQKETLENLKTQVTVATEKGKSALALHLAITAAMSKATGGIILSSGSTVPRQVKFLRKQALLDAADLDFLDKAVEAVVKNDELDLEELKRLMAGLSM